jgi:hypothetical protein
VQTKYDEFDSDRHPELVSGSTSQHGKVEFVESWMLKQVQHDEVFLCRGCLNPPLVRFGY